MEFNPKLDDDDKFVEIVENNIELIFTDPDLNNILSPENNQTVQKLLQSGIDRRNAYIMGFKLLITAYYSLVNNT